MTRSNRQSLTMPIQESTLAALRGLDIENKSGSPQYPTDSRSQSSPNIDQRPNTPTSPTSPGLPSNPLFYQSTTSNSSRQDSREASSNRSTYSRANVPGGSAEPSIRQVTEAPSQGQTLGKSKNKMPPAVAPAPNNFYLQSGAYMSSHNISRRPVPHHLTLENTRSATVHNLGPGSPLDQQSSGQKTTKRGFFNRKNSSRAEELGGSSKPSTPVTSRTPEVIPKPPSRDQSIVRNPSPLHDSEDAIMPSGNPPLREERSQSFRSDGTGSTFMRKMQASAKTVGRGLNSGANKLFMGSGSSHGIPKTTSEDPVAQELIVGYQTVYLTLPLIEQTRFTRIARRLEDSKDKTEFWMPALPWRCIDFLNFNGCEQEGLYRVPGANRTIEMWWQRFDRHGDINLFEAEDLYDVNVVGSLFKRWLRDLPEPIFPEAAQQALDRKYEDMNHAPEELKEVLSKLPPWNYYLLFAITCHLSLLNAYAEKNKMTLSNLFICIGKSLRLSSKCFYWLVGDWRSCWTGCTTEKDALEQEYRILTGDNDSSGGRKPSFSSTISAGSVGGVTLHSESEQRMPVSELQPRGQQQATSRRKENRPQRLSPRRSRDDSKDRIITDGGEQDSAPLSPGHLRSRSNVPELQLKLPGQMSPMFQNESSN